ncbi:MAG: glycosyltransferase [Chloroflexota bacterium]
MKKGLADLSNSEIRGMLLVFLGLCATSYYFSWWLEGGRLTSILHLMALCFAVAYGLMQMIAGWFVYLGAPYRIQTKGGLPKDLSVDVFVTAFGEDPEMVEKSLLAASNMEGDHKTWLLDDGDDPDLENLAHSIGVGYLTRLGNKNAKAGNLNEALKHTDGDVVVIFDIDHVPQQNFLEQTLNCFADPEVGFVQVMPTFYNDRTNGWVARAATETSLDFYNPTSIGMDAFDSVTKMGTNSIIRRAALESVGGYQPGLAEDLATSIALHAAGWRSRYVAEPLAPGLAPPDLASWFTQQLKWSRGVFEILLNTYPSLFQSLKWGQRLSYAVRTTKYWIGLVIFIHLVSLIAVLFSSDPQVKLNAQQYFLHLIPVAIADSLIRSLALSKWKHPIVRTESLWRAITLIFATWPIYTIAWVMAIFRLPLDFKPTPKKPAASVNRIWLIPQLASVALLIAGIYFSIQTSGGDVLSLWLLYLVATAFAVPQLGLLRPLLRPIFVPERPEINSVQILEAHMKKPVVSAKERS